MRRLSVMRGFGEALVQFFLIGGLIFLFERVALLQIYVLGWNPAVLWWVSETGVVLVLILLLSLLIVNLGFVFVYNQRWWLRGILESLIFLPIYFLMAYLFRGITSFDYSNLYMFILVLFVPVIMSNLVFTKYFPGQRKADEILWVVKQHEKALEG